MASIRNMESHRQGTGRENHSSIQKQHREGMSESTRMQRSRRAQLGDARSCPTRGSNGLCNTHLTAYPLRTPRTRLRTKNEPRMIRLTKYTHGHSHPIASFTCKNVRRPVISYPFTKEQSPRGSCRTTQGFEGTLLL